VAERPARARGGGVAAVLLVALAVCWIGLGSTPLHRTEGHRAIPAWHALESGSWFPTRLFGTVYLNKPPGMPWAIAASSGALGPTPFAARAVSAASITLLALLCLAAARRWFGPRFAPAGGIALLLIPGYWAIARSADIEALLCLATAVACLPLIELLAAPPDSRLARARLAAMVALGIVLAALAKGPAVAIPLLGALVGGVVGRGSVRALGAPWAWAGLVAGAAIVGGIAAALLPLIPDDESIRAQTGSEFLWRDGVPGALLYTPGVLALGLPVGLALLFPWGPDARREVERGTVGAGELALARGAAAACLATLLLGAAIGLTNPRYGLPTLALAAPVAAWVARGAAGAFDARRARIARAMLLGGGRAWALGLTALALVYGVWIRPANPDRVAGRDAGRSLASHVEPGDRMVASKVAYATPEIPWYLAEAAASRGAPVTVRWAPDGVEPSGAWDAMLLRPNEWAALEATAGPLGWSVVARAEGPGKQEIVLVRRHPVATIVEPAGVRDQDGPADRSPP
jgi:4-amino-4-deoxy-L-arabinose transferase-like glycosyltransferase